MSNPPEPKTTSFGINPAGGESIMVEGHSRFVFESDYHTYVQWARARIAALEARIEELRGTKSE